MYRAIRGIPKETFNWLAVVGRAVVLERLWLASAFVAVFWPVLLLISLLWKKKTSVSPFIYTMQ